MKLTKNQVNEAMDKIGMLANLRAHSNCLRQLMAGDYKTAFGTMMAGDSARSTKIAEYKAAVKR
jgi:hypothetical protein